MEELNYLWKRRSDVKLRALMNRIYYQERQRIFEFRDGAVKAVSIFSGSVAFANIANQQVIQVCAGIITIGTAASLVFGFGSKSRDSAKRSAEWAMLERDIEAAGERGFTEEQVCLWIARSNELESGEPAAHPGLMERSYRRACEVIGVPPTPGSLWNRYRPAIMIP